MLRLAGVIRPGYPPLQTGNLLVGGVMFPGQRQAVTQGENLLDITARWRHGMRDPRQAQDHDRDPQRDALHGGGP